MPFTALAYLAHWIERSVLACEIVSSTQSSTSISFFYCADSYCKTRAHYIVMCYSEQYVRLKRNVFSPRQKVDVDYVLFSSIGSRKCRRKTIQEHNDRMKQYDRGSLE